MAQKGCPMMYRSGKIQFLFWTAFFSILLYLWLAAVGLQTFVIPDEPPMSFPTHVATLMFILFGLLIVTTLAGVVVSMMISNHFYIRFFSAMTIFIFASMIFAKSVFG